jgi:hypothetical protein
VEGDELLLGGRGIGVDGHSIGSRATRKQSQGHKTATRMK